MTKPFSELSQAAIDVLDAAQDADGKFSASLASVSAAAIRALLPHIRLDTAEIDIRPQDYAEGLRHRERCIVMTLECLAQELDAV
jgi:hypothetical protein